MLLMQFGFNKLHWWELFEELASPVSASRLQWHRGEYAAEVSRMLESIGIRFPYEMQAPFQ